MLLAILVLAAGWYAIHRADRTLGRLLRDFAEHTVAERSKDELHLVVGRIRFNWALRHVSVDSAVLTTDTAVAQARNDSAPVLRIALYGCAITGVGLRKLLLNDGLYASRFGCEVVTVQYDVLHPPAPGTGASASQGEANRPQFLVLQRQLKLPSFAPRIHIDRIDFPHTSFVFSQPESNGNRMRLALEHLEWHLRELAIDPADPLAARRPLFSRAVNLLAENLAFRPDTVTAVQIRRLRMRLVDSTLDFDSVSYSPTVSDRTFESESPWRRTRVRLASTGIHAAGVDFGRLLRLGGAYVRRIDVDSATADIWSDKRKPTNPHPRPHLTPQTWIRGSPGSFRFDTIAVQGRLIYREVRENEPQTGVLTFTRLTALATNASHLTGRRSNSDPMVVETTAWLMNAGKLTTTFSVPLDAPAYDMSYHGTLGPMPAESLNRFIVHTLGARIASGHIEGIDFHATVRAGRARGVIEPRYLGLALAVTREGQHGVLARGGTIGHIIRSVATAVVNGSKLRPANPPKSGDPPMTAPVDHAFVTPPEQLFSFVWISLRDPLLSIVMKKH